jgi:hypothetical protein
MIILKTMLIMIGYLLLLGLSVFCSMLVLYGFAYSLGELVEMIKNKLSS